MSSRVVALLSGFCFLAGCVSSAPPPAVPAPSEPALRAAWGEIAERTFFTRSEGNLRGSIYFAANGSAVQAAQDRGVRRLSWTVQPTGDGSRAALLCVAGGYHDITGAGTDMQRNGQSWRCAPVASFRQFRSSHGNPLGLGTVIQ